MWELIFGGGAYFLPDDRRAGDPYDRLLLQVTHPVVRGGGSHFGARGHEVVVMAHGGVPIPSGFVGRAVVVVKIHLELLGTWPRDPEIPVLAPVQVRGSLLEPGCYATKTWWRSRGAFHRRRR